MSHLQSIHSFSVSSTVAPSSCFSTYSSSVSPLPCSFSASVHIAVVLRRRRCSFRCLLRPSFSLLSGRPFASTAPTMSSPATCSDLPGQRVPFTPSAEVVSSFTLAGSSPLSLYSRYMFRVAPTSPNHALQRTNPCVTDPAPRRPTAQEPRRPPQSLSLPLR